MEKEKQAVPRLSLLEVVREYPVATTIAVLTGALIGGILLFLILDRFTDDEAPIRVRNGSLELELMGTGPHAKWEKDGNTADKWKVAAGQRGKEELNVSVVLGPGGSCTSPVASDTTVRVVYKDGTKLDIDGKTKKTKIVLSDNKEFVPLSDQVLSYAPAGDFHITELQVGQQHARLCSFDRKESLVHILILDHK